MAEKEYIPFGEEWKKEMMKVSKSDLIDFLRKSLAKNRENYFPLNFIRHETGWDIPDIMQRFDEWLTKNKQKTNEEI